MGYIPVSTTFTEGDVGEYAQMVTNINTAVSAAFEGVLAYKGGITLPADFPTLSAVQTGWMYQIISNVTDNNSAKTNTGLSFSAGDEIFWSGSTWLDSNLPLPAGVVMGPSSATSGNVVLFDGGTGKLIKNSTLDPTTVVVGPASAVGDNLTSYNSTTGKLIKDSGIATANVVQGPASAVGNNLVSFNSTTGKLIQDSSITSSSVTTGAVNGAKGASVTVGTKVSTTINALVQLKDAAGTNMAVRGSVFAYLSDNSNGSTITATVPDGGVVIGTNGLAIPVVAAEAFQLVSGATGLVDLNITHSGSHTYYLVVVLAQGTLAVSGAIAF